MNQKLTIDTDIYNLVEMGIEIFDLPNTLSNVYFSDKKKEFFVLSADEKDCDNIGLFRYRPTKFLDKLTKSEMEDLASYRGYENTLNLSWGDIFMIGWIVKVKI